MATVQIRIDDQEKEEVRAILQNLGLDLTSAIKIFFSAVKREQGIPFSVQQKTPNALTANTINKAKQGVDLVECEDMDDLFQKLES